MKSTKELKAEYKQKVFRGGVFQIRNTADNKIFVGSSPNFDAIFNRHRLQLEFGGHPNKELQADWNTLGPEGFAFEEVAEVKPRENESQAHADDLREMEALYLEELQPFGERGYHKRSVEA